MLAAPGGPPPTPNLSVERQHFYIKLQSCIMINHRTYTNYIRCSCGFIGESIEARQHRECPQCHSVVEACCEGNNCY